MKNDAMEDKIKALAEKIKIVDKPARRRIPIRERSSLEQIIRTKEQADEFMEKLNRAFNRVP